jgi:hypothetical protein
VASGDLTVGEAPPTPSRGRNRRARPLRRRNVGEGSSLATLTMPIGALLELFPCAAALWSADRSECVFNRAMKALVSYCEDDFCADKALWLGRIDPRDRGAFLSSWKTLQKGQAKISCRYRFTPPGRLSIDMEESAMLVPIGPAGTSAVLSLYQTKAGIHRGDTAIRSLVHHMGNSLQAIRGEVDLLHLTGVLPQQSFDNITRGIEQINDLLGEITGLPGVERLSLVHGGRR